MIDLSYLGEFDIILADPPWLYEVDQRHERCRGAVSTHYQCMPIEEIKSIKIPGKKDSMLFLWCTSPMLPYGIDVIKSWGYNYRTSTIWDKLNPVSKTRISGMGNYFWINHEFLLIARRGNIRRPLPENRFGSIFKGKRREHSHKPEVVYEMIETMYPNTKKIELFARRRREGWTVYGNQIDSCIQTTLKNVTLEA